MKKKIVLIFLLLLISACSAKSTTETVEELSTPTPTSLPMALLVNGEGITVEEYEAELLRYALAVEQSGKPIDGEMQKTAVLDELTRQVLLSQCAADQGYFVDETVLQQRMNDLIQQVGGVEKLNEWMANNFYDEQSFRTALVRNISAAWMRDQIIDAVPDTAEQIHARQIFLQNENIAISIQRQIQAGTPFETIAFQYDSLTGGDLGWFPRGYLFQPTIEEAAFNLQVGEVSDVIRTDYGFHIIQVIERDENRLLSPDAKLLIQRQALEKWLQDKLQESIIEIAV